MMITYNANNVTGFCVYQDGKLIWQVRGLADLLALAAEILKAIKL